VDLAALQFPLGPFPSYEMWCFRAAGAVQGAVQTLRSEPLTARTARKAERRRATGFGALGIRQEGASPTTNPESPSSLRPSFTGIESHVGFPQHPLNSAICISVHGQNRYSGRQFRLTRGTGRRSIRAVSRVEVERLNPQQTS
jgi:hypothetical protein